MSDPKEKTEEKIVKKINPKLFSRSLFFNSSDADHDFGYSMYGKTVNYQIFAPEDKHLYYIIDSVTIPQGYYSTIRDGINDIIVVEVYDGVDLEVGTTITLAEGDYNIYQLITEIKSHLAIQLAEFDFEITYSRISKKLSWSITTASYSMKIVYEDTSAHDVIGLSDDISIPYNTPTTLQKVINMNSLSAIDVVSSLKASNYSSHSGDMSNVICRIPCDRIGGVLTYKPRLPTKHLIDSRHISHFMFGLRDDQGRNLDNNGKNWTISIQIFIE